MSAPDATPARGDVKCELCGFAIDTTRPFDVDEDLFFHVDAECFDIAREQIATLTAERDALAARVRVLEEALALIEAEWDSWLESASPGYMADLARAALASPTRIPTATPYAPADARSDDA